MNVATRFTVVVGGFLLVVIAAMSLSFYVLSKQFYYEQLEKDITSRLLAHREILEQSWAADTQEHVFWMEQRQEDNVFLILNEQFEPMMAGNTHDQRWIKRYVDWIQSNDVNDQVTLELVHVMEEHIPHVWATVPVHQGGHVAGYLFLDHDTGLFEHTRTNLVMLTAMMGALTLLLSGALLYGLIRKVTAPIKTVQKATKKIAKGAFDTRLPVHGSDEIGDLMGSINEMASRLKQLTESRNELISNISHELRTPLTYIKAYAALLKKREGLTEDGKDQAMIIHEEAIRMERLVGDLFELMKLEERNVSFHLTKTDLEAVVERSVRVSTIEGKKKNVTLAIHKEHSPLFSLVDSGRLEQVMQNLLSNAIRHTPSNGTINLTLYAEERKNVISVSDNGEGIDSDKLPFIWDRFYRADRSRNSKYGGTGLGLAITKQLVEQMGGTIFVDSEKGKGTTFTLIFAKEEEVEAKKLEK
ncbi:HAMP domain-containing sensor histidine kinase [Halalkalibacterium halodurans]|uniref:HAMP domain-containing sensor histidine kinase n=1 Tax=Halalkalibacterium halodurans TaxID=86665 RepID=UPI002AA9D451|nr:HAMP domain-containing sensor histidine kinase [Halalkalibacterium halodurans]MDY7222814.1 HAMP domain-containing sensor histidine kinase [Halalkalibacterium halodurans]MDY7242035.1 HAMP domain-containing sensor histidine kinase [Halalkalibacterium halodurans]